jgi:hypothetical protein
MVVSGNHASIAGEQSCTLRGHTATTRSVEATAIDATTHTSSGTASEPGIGEVRVSATCVRR